MRHSKTGFLDRERTHVVTHTVTHVGQHQREANSTKASSRLISDSENVLPTHIEIETAKMAAKIGRFSLRSQQLYARPLSFFPRDIKNNRERSGENVFFFFGENGVSEWS